MIKFIISTLIFLVGLSGFGCFAQGKINRPTNSTTVNNSVSGVINGHKYVDLGLPSGLKWATCNIGANTPESFGNYFAWGETTQKPVYDESTCLTHAKTTLELKKNGYLNSQGILAIAHDAANSNWGGSWRMPTLDEFNELKSNCKWNWTTQSGKKGFKITGPNGQSIFLPAAGTKMDSSFFPSGGMYWTSSLPPDDWFESAAYRVEINMYNVDPIIDGGVSGRIVGLTIRPVSK